MNFIFLILTLFLSASLVFAEDSSLADKQQHYASLFQRQESLQSQYKEIYLALTDINKQESLKTWYRLFLKNQRNVEVFNHVMKSSSQWVLGKDYRLLIYYYTVTGQSQQAGQALGFYLLSAHTLLDNFVNDPQAQSWSSSAVQTVRSHLPHLSLTKIDNVRECYTQFIESKGVTRGFSRNHSYLFFQGLEKCAKKDRYTTQLNKSLDQVFRIEKYPGAPFPVSFTGYVGDNDVKLYNRIPMDPADILMIGDQLHLARTRVVETLNKPYKDLSIEEFKSLMDSPEAAIDNLFTDEEGFKNIHHIENLSEIGYITDSKFHGHPSFRQLNGQNGIFGQMIQSIRDAQNSVFIDLFWMGGTIGMNLAKELFKKVVENPDFTVVIITDNENKFQYGVELDMIYRYMRAFSEKFVVEQKNGEERNYNFYITSADINQKRTALPEFVDLLITNNVVNKLHGDNNIKSVLAKDGFHLLAKSDHTKVMVMDGKNPENGVAYVGSKNWTDSSGAANFDEMAAIKGPAAALILDAFYYDSLEAFLLDARADLGGDMVNQHWQAKYPEEKKRVAIQKMLSPIDVLNRHSKINYNVPYVSQGNSIVAPTQNNIYGTEIAPIEQNIQTILSAKKQIIVDDQFLYDPKIVEALKVAKLEHGVDIYVILESLLPYNDTSKVGAHIPNNLFIPELTAIGIEVKWQNTPTSLWHAIIEDAQKHPGQIISATFHVKSMSADGVLLKDSEACAAGEGQITSDDVSPVLITGSANKDIMTMSGGFRESQVAVYDTDSVISHDCLFWKRWMDPDSTVTTDGLDFDLPAQAEAVGITDKKVFLNTLRQIIFSTYNFTKDFF